MNTKEKIAVMQAHLEGKHVQLCGYGSGVWQETSSPMWDWVSYNYRIKPEPVKGWVPVWDTPDGCLLGRVYSTKTLAEGACLRSCELYPAPDRAVFISEVEQ